MRFAREHNVTHIVIGRSDKSRWREWLEGSATHDLIRIAGDVSVHVVSGHEKAPSEPKGSVQVAGGTEFSATPYIASLAITAVALGCGLVLHQFLDVENIGIVFLMGVLTSALWYGLAQGIFTSIVSALAFNFFFLPPLYTLTIGKRGKRHYLHVLPHRRGHRQQPDGARARASGRGPAASAHDRGSLSLQQEACRNRHPGRCSLGDRVPDCLHAEGACRPAAAGEWNASP